MEQQLYYVKLCIVAACPKRIETENIQVNDLLTYFQLGMCALQTKIQQ